MARKNTAGDADKPAAPASAATPARGATRGGAGGATRGGAGGATRGAEPAAGRGRRAAAAPSPLRNPTAGKRTVATRAAPTKRDLRDFRGRLQAELTELTGQRDELEESANASSPAASGEVGFDEEYADAGSYTFERERDLSLASNVRDLIAKVERALERIDEGTFGRCEACGKPIERERLDALPYATLCLADARRQVRPR
jgi:DnaK suppressor protein